jgi:hypothetical protein
MAIQNMDDLSNSEVVTELNNGGRFVGYYFCISIVIMTFRRGSNVYFLRSGENPIRFGWKYLLISLILGWWGFPWGPIYTVQSILMAFKGKDITKEVIAQLSRGVLHRDIKFQVAD